MKVDVVLTFEVHDELALAEAGFRRYREVFGAVADSAENITPDMRALQGLLAETPEMALSTLLGLSGGPLNSIELPGARVVGVGVSGPVIPGGTLQP